MSDLIDKLKSLGLNLGTGSISPTPPKRVSPNLVEALAGDYVQNKFGTTFVVENKFPYGSQENLMLPVLQARLQPIANWCGDPSLMEHDPESIVFVDTETTSLGSGAGTYTFLIGAGKFSQDHFEISQFFLQDPLHEPPQLYALEEFIAGCRAIVTYNGKSFDVPLLNSRYLANGWKPLFSEFIHIDLLHLVRRLWRDRLPSRTLGSVETNLLAITRRGQDVDGWLIPQIYFNYLQLGETADLKNVLYHNLIDVLSLSQLFNYTLDLLNDPFQFASYEEDFLSLARFFDDTGNTEMAIDLYQHCLTGNLPSSKTNDALMRLALIHKHRDEFESANPLWERAAGEGDLDACVELAKYYEHRLMDYPKALRRTEDAIKILERKDFTRFEKRKWLEELEHRHKRLLRLNQKSNT
jgi:uncharacterized protein YprB with RNaseH-like and TPR domain